MEKQELKAAMRRTKVSSCDTILLSALLGHLAVDHGMTDDELRALTDALISAIANFRKNPQSLKDLQNAVTKIRDQVSNL